MCDTLLTNYVYQFQTVKRLEQKTKHNKQMKINKAEKENIIRLGKEAIAANSISEHERVLGQFRSIIFEKPFSYQDQAYKLFRTIYDPITVITKN